MRLMSMSMHARGWCWATGTSRDRCCAWTRQDFIWRRCKAAHPRLAPRNFRLGADAGVRRLQAFEPMPPSARNLHQRRQLVLAEPRRAARLAVERTMQHDARVFGQQFTETGLRIDSPAFPAASDPSAAGGDAADFLARA